MANDSRFRLTYTIEEAAALIGVGRSTMYELVRSGEVPALQVGGRRLVTAPTITALTGVTPPPPGTLRSPSSASSAGAASASVVEAAR